MRRLLLALLLSLAATPLWSQVSVPAGSKYVASARGQVYYPVWCSAWHSLAVPNLRWFSSADVAESAGYRRTGSRACDPARARARSRLDRDGTDALAGTCTVARIIDGDTLVCREGSERIRLLLVDAPERAQGDYGRQATQALARLLPPGAIANVELDVRARDRYGRILAYLYTEDGRMVNEELARRGFVVTSVHPPNVRHVERIRAAVAAARSARVGLWSGSAFDCTPADHRAGRC